MIFTTQVARRKLIRRILIMFFALGALLQLVALVNAQTVYLAGDSTMAKNGAGSGTGTDGKALC